MDLRVLIRIKFKPLIYKQGESKGNKTKHQIARNSPTAGTEETSLCCFWDISFIWSLNDPKLLSLKNSIFRFRHRLHLLPSNKPCIKNLFRCSLNAWVCLPLNSLLVISIFFCCCLLFWEIKKFETIHWLKMFRASTAATAAFDRCNDKKVVKRDLE